MISIFASTDQVDEAIRLDILEALPNCKKSPRRWGDSEIPGDAVLHS